MQMAASSRMEHKLEFRRRVKYIAALVLGIAGAGLFFLPCLEIVINDTMYTMSGFQIVTYAGILVQTNGQSVVLAMPFLLKAAALCCAVLFCAGVLLLLFGKPIASGVGFAVGALTPFLALIASGEIQAEILNLNISSSRFDITFLWTFWLLMLLGLAAAVCALWTRGSERLAQAVFFAFSCVSVGAVLLIMIYMLCSGAPAIAEIGLGDFLFGTEWDGSNGQFGILWMILASVAATLGAILIGVPIGLMTAVFLSELSHRKVAGIVRPAIELLAGIPSVVYGFFGMLMIVPVIRNVFGGFQTLDGRPVVGDSLLAVILVLAIMILPTIVSTAEVAMRAVPRSFREASLGLGATPIQTIFKVTLPAARSGILSGVILGVGRAIGETMAVIMVAGNIVNAPELLGSVRLLTTGIAIDMAYSSGLFRQALFGIGLVLFVFVMIVNASFMIVSKRGVQIHE